jgi:hypothetical protein
LRQNFEQRLLPLLFAESKPDFEACFSTFATVAQTLLDAAQSARGDA